MVILSTIAIMVLLGNKHPYLVVSRNYTELNSEFAIIIVMDLLLAASDPKLSGDSTEMMGFGIIGVMGLSILASQGMLLYGAAKDICTKCRLRRIRAKNKKIMQKKARKL